MRVRENDDWFRTGLPVKDISDLLEIVRSIQRVKGKVDEEAIEGKIGEPSS